MKQKEIDGAAGEDSLLASLGTSPTGPADIPVSSISVAELETFVQTTRSRILPVRFAELFDAHILAPEHIERAYHLLGSLVERMRILLASALEEGSAKSRPQRLRRYRRAHLILLCNYVGVASRYCRADRYAARYEEIDLLRCEVDDPLWRIVAGNMIVGSLMRSGAVAEGLALSADLIAMSSSAGLHRAEVMTRMNRVATLSFINDQEAAAEAAAEATSAIALLVPERAIEKGDWLWSHVRMGEAYRSHRDGRIKEAIICCREIVAEGPDAAPLLYLDAQSMLCRLYSEVEHFDEALDVARQGLRRARVMAVRSSATRFWGTIAMLYQGLGRVADAEAAAEQGLRGAEQYVDDFLLLSMRLLYAQVLVEQGRYDKALELLAAAADLEAVHVDRDRGASIRRERARVFRLQGDFDRAGEEIEQGIVGLQDIEVGETLVALYVEQALLFEVIGRRQEGIAELEQTLQICRQDRQRAEIHRLLSDRYEEVGDLAAALSHLKCYNTITAAMQTEAAENRMISARIMFEVEIHQQQARLDRSRRRVAEERLEEVTIDLTERSALITQVRRRVNEAISLVQDDEGDEAEITRLRRILRQLDEIAVVDKDQIRRIGSVDDAFFRSIRRSHSQLSQGEIRFAGLIRAGLTGSDIAATLHITPESVRQKRYRLPKRLGLSGQKSLEGYLEAFGAPA